MPNATEIDLAEQSEVNAELDRRISDMIVRQDGGWVCTVCGKQANHKSKLKQHAETHLQGYSHPCIMCGKSYRSRNVLRMHMSRDHRSKGHLDQVAGSGHKTNVMSRSHPHQLNLEDDLQQALCG